MHPSYGDDYYRYTRVGLQHLLRTAGLRMVWIEAPLGLFTILANMLVATMSRTGLRSIRQPARRTAARLDRTRRWTAYAATYLLVAVKPEAEAGAPSRSTG